MEPIRDESELPVICVQPPRPVRGDLLATTTFWLALVGVSTILWGWINWPGGSHWGEEKLLARGIMNVGSVFAIAAFLLTVPLLCRYRRSTRTSRLAMWLSLVGFALAILAPAI